MASEPLTEKEVQVAIDPANDEAEMLYSFDKNGKATKLDAIDAPENATLVVAYCSVCDDDGAFISSLIMPNDISFRDSDGYNYKLDHNGKKWYHLIKVCSFFANQGTEGTTDLSVSFYTKARWWKGWKFKRADNITNFGDCLEEDYSGYRLEARVRSNYRNYDVFTAKFNGSPWEEIF